MFGIIWGLSNLLGIGVAKTVESVRNNIEDNSTRVSELEKFNNGESFNKTYYSYTGLRDIETNVKVDHRTNEKGDDIVYTIIGKEFSGNYKDIRNVSESKRKFKLQENIKKAKEENKTVALKYSDRESDMINGILHPKEGARLNHYNVPTYQDILFIYGNGETLADRKEKRCIKGYRFHDLETGEEYVIREFTYMTREYNGRWYDPSKKYTSFYMSTKNGHIIRRTDNQLINDKNYPEESAVKIEDTENFIKTFNEMQDKNKELLKDEDFYNNYWYNTYANHYELSKCSSKNKWVICSLLGSNDCDIINSKKNSNQILNLNNY